jgi:hypothetical protein
LAKGPPLSSKRSPLATLVHQGSDPTLPYQALGDPTERHASFQGVKAATGPIGVVRLLSPYGQVRSVSPFGLDCIIVTPNRAKSSGKISLSRRGPLRHRLESWDRAARRGSGFAMAGPELAFEFRPALDGLHFAADWALLVLGPIACWKGSASAAYSAAGIQSAAARKSRKTWSNGVLCTIEKLLNFSRILCRGRQLGWRNTCLPATIW